MNKAQDLVNIYIFLKGISRCCGSAFAVPLFCEGSNEALEPEVFECPIILTLL